MEGQAKNSTLSVEVQTRDWQSVYKHNRRAADRKRRRSGYLYLSAEELRLCQHDLTLIREIRGPEWIACPLCGLLAKNLAPHLVTDHGEQLSPGSPSITNTRERSQVICLAFRKRFGLYKSSGSFPLCSQQTREAMSQRKKASGRIPPGKITDEVRQAALNAIREYGVSPAQRRSASKARQGKRLGFGGGTRDSKVPPHQIANLRFDRKTEHEIAAKCGLVRATVIYHLRKMGFPCGSPFALYHGEPLDRHHLKLLIEDWIAVNCAEAQSNAVDLLKPHTQLKLSEAAQVLGVSVSWVYGQTRGRARVQHLGVRRGRYRYLGTAQVQYLQVELEKIRRAKFLARAHREITQALKVNPYWIIHRLRAKNESWPISEEMAGRIVMLWDQLKNKWRSQGATKEGGRPKKLLPSEQAILPHRYRSLLTDLKSLLKWLKSEDARISQRGLQEWICAQARMGRMRTLLFWRDVFHWIGRGFDSNSGRGMNWAMLFEHHWQPSEVTADFIASDFDLAPRTLTDFLSRTARRQPKPKTT